MLRFSHRDPKKSANQEVDGTFDFNKRPLAPLGTKALMYDDPASHASWAPHAIDNFYVGPSPDHYRCLHFYIPTTRRFRFSHTWQLYPMHSQVPMTSQPDIFIAATSDLLQAFGTNVPTLATAKHKYIRAIQDLTAIMAEQQATLLPIDSQSYEGGSSRSEGGTCYTSKGGHYIKQHHCTQCHPTNAVNPPAPHTQQQPIPDPSLQRR